MTKLDVELRTLRPARPNIDRLRAALHQRAAQWKADLRDERKSARLLLDASSVRSRRGVSFPVK